MRPEPQVRDLTPGEFSDHLGTLTDIYAAAMGPPPEQVLARQTIMERHAGYARFRAVAGAAQAGPSTAAAADGLVTGFAYGFHGEPGQWWHDLVLARLTAEHGAVAADHWLGDSFEVAEVHVHPDFQGCGTGRAMVLRLVAECPERTAVLSTMDGNTRARRLYRGLGFLTLLSGFTFPGAPEPYAVMGAALPLRGLPRPGGRTQPGHSPAGKPESLVDVECGT